MITRTWRTTQIKTKMKLTDIYNFYISGFKAMTIGRILWLIILVKLFIMFFVLKLFFFPSFLKNKTEKEKQEYVSNELIRRVLSQEETIIKTN